jgi:short-subunit dehydrogenase
MTTLTKAHHRLPYPAIHPSSPSNSQTGRTILITGSSTGIGFATARAFVTANASQVIVLGRRDDILQDAVVQLEAAKPPGSTTKILLRQCDIANGASLEELWQGLKSDGVNVDVLILNAAMTGPLGVNSPWRKVWEFFEMNVLANLRMTEKFLSQGSEAGKVSISRLNLVHGFASG